MTTTMTEMELHADLLSHSESVAEIHALAAWAAQIVRLVRESDALLPSELRELTEQIATRTSVIRRLREGASP